MIRQPKNANAKLRAAVSLTAALAAVLLTGATVDDAETLELRRRRIEGMTQTDINQLKRNFDNFRKLTPPRREELIRLHDELRQDSRNNGHLQKLLEDYNRWFSGLSPFDRERLLGVPDPSQRVKIVQKIRDEQKQLRLALARYTGGGGRKNGLDQMRPNLSAKDFDLIVTAVEQKFLAPDSRQLLPKNLTGRERHFQILRLAREKLVKQRNEEIDTSPQEMALINTVIEAIPNETMKVRIASHTDPAEVRRMVGQILRRLILDEWKPEIDAAWPTEAEIDERAAKRLASLPNPQKREEARVRFKNQEGRHFLAVDVVLTKNTQLKKLRPVVTWLYNGLHTPKPPPGPNAGGQDQTSSAMP